MSLGEATLLAFRDGDRDAFARIVDGYGGMIRAVATRHFHSVFWQEEAVQEIWLHVLQKRQALDPGRLDSFQGWLTTLARRKCLDLIRSWGGGREISAHDAGEPAARPENPGERLELREAVTAFKASLAPSWRRFFAQHFEQGLSYPEISALTGQSRLRCKYMKKVLLGRARRNRRLLAALGRYQTEP